MNNEIFNIAQKYQDEFAKLRQHFHKNPELSFKEFKTSDKVAELLEGWGYTVKRGYAGTGLVGQLKKGNGDKKLGIRADMDALPIKELNDFEHKSQNEGVMHGCGHDGHTTMLLCAAKILAEDVDFNGTLNLIFQPAEEVNIARSGGALMVKDGVFEDFPCDSIFAAHNGPGIPVGTVAIRKGNVMASADSATIKFIGDGGHAAMPHLNIDPVVAASSFVVAAQSIVARNINPLRAAVVSVSVVQAGHMVNVIPDEATVRISVRCFDDDVRETLKKRITDLATKQAESYGCKAEVDYELAYPVCRNADEETELAIKVAKELLGEDKVLDDPEPHTGSEDFAFMLQERPGCYFFMGNGAPDQKDKANTSNTMPLHNPRFDFNDQNISIGGAYWALLAKRFLV